MVMDPGIRRDDGGFWLNSVPFGSEIFLPALYSQISKSRSPVVSNITWMVTSNYDVIVGFPGIYITLPTDGPFLAVVLNLSNF